MNEVGNYKKSINKEWQGPMSSPKIYGSNEHHKLIQNAQTRAAKEQS